MFINGLFTAIGGNSSIFSVVGTSFSRYVERLAECLFIMEGVPQFSLFTIWPMLD